VTIESADEAIDDGDPPLRSGAVPGPSVRLTVTDSGTGMDVDTLAHVFEPFFTTKQLGRGSGLGRTSVEGVVAQSGGFVTVDSAVGLGSSFVIQLPRATGAQACATWRTRRRRPARGSPSA